MAPAAVRYHPAAAQEAEPTLSGMPREIPQRYTAFVKNYDRRSMRSLRAPEPGPARAAALDGTSSRATPSVWCTSFAAMASRSLRWPTVGAGLATGGRDSDTLYLW
jgi:hypothetical protein